MRLAAVVLSATLALAACGGDGGSDGGGGSNGDGGSGGGADMTREDIFVYGPVNVEEPSGDPKKGGTLVVAEYGEARSLNPVESIPNGAVGGSQLAAVYDTLMRYDWDNKEWVPQLAESLETEDNKTWTLTLREDAKFSDGTPVNADAVIGSVEHYTQNYGHLALTYLSAGGQAKKVDDRTVEFVLQSELASFPHLLGSGMGMIVAPAGLKNPKQFKAIGAGPFMEGDYTPGSKRVLEKNPDYWGGEPNLDSIEFVMLASDDARKDSFNSGDVDSVYVRAPQVVDELRRSGAQGMMMTFGMGSIIGINTREGRPGSDPKVREAIKLGFDNESYIERTAGGVAIATKSVFPDSSQWSTGVEWPEPDVEAAKAALDEAKSNGYDGKITYTHMADPTSQNAAVQVEAQLEAIGFDVTLEPLDNIADFTRKTIVEPDFDISVSSYSLAEEDPSFGLSSGFSEQSPTNSSGFHSPELDAALAKLRASMDEPDVAKEAMVEVESIIEAEAPVVPISPLGTFLPWADNVHGISPSTESLLLFDKAWKE